MVILLLLFDRYRLVKLYDLDDLNALRKHVGIKMSDDHQSILEWLSQVILWESKYPTPKNRKAWDRARAIFSDLRESEKLGNSGLMVQRRNPNRSITFESYSEIWSNMSKKYFVCSV